jgi:hypothetical protein
MELVTPQGNQLFARHKKNYVIRDKSGYYYIGNNSWVSNVKYALVFYEMTEAEQQLVTFPNAKIVQMLTASELVALLQPH